MTLPLRILAAGLLLAAALVGLVIYEARARASGREVLLAMEAFDPRSILSGHYAALQLSHALPPGAPCPDTPDRAAWLALKRSGSAHVLSGVAASRRQALTLGDVAVRGKSFCRPLWADGEQTGQQSVTLDIGVDRFHADQDEARSVEKTLAAIRPGQEPQAFAVVSIGADGRARLKGLVIEGRRTDLTWF